MCLQLSKSHVGLGMQYCPDSLCYAVGNTSTEGVLLNRATLLLSPSHLFCPTYSLCLFPSSLTSGWHLRNLQKRVWPHWERTVSPDIVLANLVPLTSLRLFSMLSTSSLAPLGAEPHLSGPLLSSHVLRTRQGSVGAPNALCNEATLTSYHPLHGRFSPCLWEQRRKKK